jgi:3-phosphoshikimate 1-carboxyvinyltransferase
MVADIADKAGWTAMNPLDTWPAPLATNPVQATVSVPGSKSQTNRALVLAALATPQGSSTVTGALRSRDTDLMIGALHTLGVALDGSGTELSVSGAIAPAPSATIDSLPPAGGRAEQPDRHFRR